MSRRLDADMGTFAIVPRWLMEHLGDHPDRSRAIELYAWLWCVYADRAKREGVANRVRLADELHTCVRNIGRAVGALREVGAITTTRAYTDGLVTGMQFTLHMVPREGGESRSLKSTPNLKATCGPKGLKAAYGLKTYESHMAFSPPHLKATCGPLILCTVPEEDLRERGASAPTRALPTPEPDPTEDRPPQTPEAKVEPGEVFFSAWEAHHPGQRADRTPKNAARLAEAISIHGLPTVEAAIDAYFTDPYTAERGHSVAMFVSQIGQLAVSRKPRVRGPATVAPARVHECPHTDDPCATTDECIDRQGQKYRTQQAVGGARTY